MDSNTVHEFASSNNVIKTDIEQGRDPWKFLKWLNPGFVLPLLAGALFLLLWELQIFHRIFDLKKYQLPLPPPSLKRCGIISVCCSLTPGIPSLKLFLVC